MAINNLNQNQKPTLKRALTLWLAGFLISAILLYSYFHAPIGPILIAGILTFFITYVRYSSKKK